MKYTKEQTLERLDKIIDVTELHVVIFAVASGIIALAILVNLAFQNYLTAWILVLPFILTLYLTIKENFYYNMLDNIDDLFKRGE